ncbi:hypothetical protein ERJ75_000878900 [Trypanosoma vivax]|uniref:Guanine nucleotide-binding protein subunit beta-like protein n=1 Tax=Trypanosoma vivax (strain Y486) TaxID=1055687 RepID=G0TXH0_TRYVY|nr:hypothetical protein ERJ75_000878900 [Trypanosoma vivax]CCC48660.1 conserved hypothetical protein [Trypanosoma vivax Y486]
MPVSISSSSSDEELVAALRNNIGRTSTRERACPSLIPRNVLYNGESIEIRCGTIYCPFRKRYFHIHWARHNPAAFFGDGNVRRHLRQSISPSSILLLDTSIPDGEVAQSTNVTLLEASDKGFYIFDGVKDLKQRMVDTRYSLSPIHEGRYARIVLGTQLRNALESPGWLRTKGICWERTHYSMHPSSVVSCFPDGRFVFTRNEPQLSLYVVEDNKVARHATVNDDSVESVLGLYVAGPTSLVMARHGSIQYLRWDPDSPLDPVTWITSRCPVAFSIVCPTLLMNDQGDPCVMIASECTLFSGIILEGNMPVIRKLHTFRKTPISSLGAYSSGALVGKVVVCGMRNGTIQVQPLELIKTRSFDTSVRHNGSSVSYLYCVPDTFNFVSVSSCGEVKLWDVRYMSTVEPVSEIGGCTGVQRYHGSQATFCGDIACATRPDGHISCFNMRKWCGVAQLRRIGGADGRLHLVQRTFGYEILDVSVYGTMSHSLPVI